MNITGLVFKGSFAFLAAGSAATIGLLTVKKSLTRDVVAIALSVICVAGVFVYSYFIEPNWIKIHHVQIHDKNLARRVGNLKIVHITDLHLHDGVGFREKQMIEKVNALQPDLIFVTGDIIDDLTQVKPANQIFKSLHAKLGMFGVPGNTDHIVMDSPSLARQLAQSGIDILKNENRQLRFPNHVSVWLVGADDPVYGYARLQDAVGGVPEGATTILLAHSPDIFEQAVEERINLVLVGHTHGGQVGIPFLVHLSNYANRTPYMRGLFTKGQTKMYVNTGIGTKTLPIRFLCRPEIAVIEVVE